MMTPERLVKYKITVSGCDDHTTIEIELSEEQFNFLSMIAKEITDASKYECMPRMEIANNDDE